MVEAATTRIDAQAYLDAQARRGAGTAAWEGWFAAHRVDAVLEPTLIVVPSRRGPGYEPGHAGGVGDPMIALTALWGQWDMTGMPVVSLPATWEVGVSLAGRRGSEADLVRLAFDLQAHRLGVPDFPAPA